MMEIGCKFLQRLDDEIFAPIHRQRERLQDKMIAVAIDDHAGQTIAFAPDQPTELRIHSAARAIFHRLREPARKKIRIEFLPASRKTPGDDLRFGIVNRAAEQPVFSVFQRDDVAVGWIAKDLQHFAGENPIMAMEDAGARFDDEAGHVGRQNVERSTLNVQRSNVDC